MARRAPRRPRARSVSWTSAARAPAAAGSSRLAAADFPSEARAARRVPRDGRGDVRVASVRGAGRSPSHRCGPPSASSRGWRCARWHSRRRMPAGAAGAPPGAALGVPLSHHHGRCTSCTTRLPASTRTCTCTTTRRRWRANQASRGGRGDPAPRARAAPFAPRARPDRAPHASRASGEPPLVRSTFLRCGHVVVFVMFSRFCTRMFSRRDATRRVINTRQRARGTRPPGSSTSSARLGRRHPPSPPRPGRPSPSPPVVARPPLRSGPSRAPVPRIYRAKRVPQRARAHSSVIFASAFSAASARSRRRSERFLPRQPPHHAPARRARAANWFLVTARGAFGPSAPPARGCARQTERDLERRVLQRVDLRSCSARLARRRPRRRRRCAAARARARVYSLRSCRTGGGSNP